MVPNGSTFKANVIYHSLKPFGKWESQNNCSLFNDFSGAHANFNQAIKWNQTITCQKPVKKVLPFRRNNKAIYRKLWHFESLYLATNEPHPSCAECQRSVREVHRALHHTPFLFLSSLLGLSTSGWTAPSWCLWAQFSLMVSSQSLTCTYSDTVWHRRHFPIESLAF